MKARNVSIPTALYKETSTADYGRSDTPVTSGQVLVVHPGLQHAHQLAWALHSAGHLKSLWCGVPVRLREQQRPIWLPRHIWDRMKATDLTTDVYRVHPHWLAGVKLLNNIGNPAARFRNVHRWMHQIDQWVAPRIANAKPTAVVGYENSCLHIFNAAKTAGALCILDAASLHFAKGNELLPSPDVRFQPVIDHWKQREIDLADVIICCSDLARESYLAAGVPNSKVYSLPLGATLPDNTIAKVQPPEGHILRFAFAGAMQARKSIDLVLQSFKRLHEQRPGQTELHIFGGSDGSDWIHQARALPNVHYAGPLSQRELYRQLAQCHALLLPSRFDSFGMVVAEAMAVGTPAIVSTRTGAKTIIEKNPGAGWIVEPEFNSIYAQVLHLVDNRDLLVEARKTALLAAEKYTWAGYRKRVVDTFSAIL